VFRAERGKEKEKKKRKEGGEVNRRHGRTLRGKEREKKNQRMRRKRIENRCGTSILQKRRFVRAGKGRKKEIERRLFPLEHEPCRKKGGSTGRHIIPIRTATGLKMASCASFTADRRGRNRGERGGRRKISKGRSARKKKREALAASSVEMRHHSGKPLHLHALDKERKRKGETFASNELGGGEKSEIKGPGPPRAP